MVKQFINAAHSKVVSVSSTCPQRIDIPESGLEGSREKLWEVRLSEIIYSVLQDPHEVAMHVIYKVSMRGENRSVQTGHISGYPMFSAYLY